MPKKTILLTGATGFLGSHLLKALLQVDSIEVISLKRSTSKLDRWTQEMRAFKSYDLDRITLSEIFTNHKVDIIIHTAVDYGRDKKSCFSVLETNLMFPISLLEEAVTHNVKMFINTDSYFNKENLAYSSLLNYALSKKSLRAWLSYFSEQIKVINLTLEHLYGPLDSSTKFVEHVIRKIAVEKAAFIDLTDGQQKRDFIFIDDVVAAFLCVLDEVDSKFTFRDYNVGTGKVISIRDFVTLVKEISGSDTILNFGAFPYRDDEIMKSKANNLELQNLGWEMKFSPEDGIHKILGEYNASKS